MTIGHSLFWVRAGKLEKIASIKIPHPTNNILRGSFAKFYILIPIKIAFFVMNAEERIAIIAL